MSTARYSLNVYDPETDEITKILESRGLKWGELVDIIERMESADDSDNDFALVEDLMLCVFRTATKEDLRNCYIDDMKSVLNQVMAMGQSAGLTGKPGKKGKQAKNR